MATKTPTEGTMEKLSEERKGQIAHQVLHARMRREGVRLMDPTQMRRDLGNLSESSKIPIKELEAYYAEFVEEWLEEMRRSLSNPRSAGPEY
jgi:hypothetical protein